VFERFTERARQVVVLAQEEARSVELKHNYIGTEHLLLGLLREQKGIAARVLGSFEITVEGVRGQVVRIVDRGEQVTSGQIPFTPRAKAVLENADTEARALGDNYIGTEHILLALGLDRQSVAARILVDYDASAEKIRDRIPQMMVTPASRLRGDSGIGTQRRPGARVLNEPTHSSATTPPGIEPGWLDGLPLGLLARLGAEIRVGLGRAPDVGDLLLVLACVPHTPAAKALSQHDVDVEQLSALIERARAEEQAARDELADRVLETARAKEKAIEESRLEDAARLRDRERQLHEEAHARPREQLAALDELRTLLQIPDPNAP
jgi:hypothetical protein